MDKIPRKISERKLTLARGVRIYPSIFSSDKIDYINAIKEHHVDSLIVILEDFDFDIIGIEVMVLINNYDEAIRAEWNTVSPSLDIVYEEWAKKTCVNCGEERYTRRCMICCMYYCSKKCQKID